MRPYTKGAQVGQVMALLVAVLEMASLVVAWRTVVRLVATIVAMVVEVMVEGGTQWQ